METGWWRRNSFGGGDDSSGTPTAGDDIWDDISTPPPPPPPGSGTRCYDWTDPTAANATATASSTRVPEASVIHALLFGDGRVGSGSNSVMPQDPHMICLQLGKRHYCEDAVVPAADRQLITAEMESSSSVTKRGKQQPYPYGDLTDITAAAAAGRSTTTVWPAAASQYSSPVGVRVTTSVPRCQVEGCHVALANTKEYYRRHKVCEIHSKSPKVVVLGLQQRFCQQCSRFHRVMEFDEAKRSCRRRLEGHNQRRRKGSFSNSLTPNFPHSHENNCMMERQLIQASPSGGCALSLLSSPKTEPWITSDDLSSRCSAALYELIAANRATCVEGHRGNQDSYQQSDVKNAMHSTQAETQMWDGLSDTAMTLDRKQAPALSFGVLSVKEKAKNPPEDWTDYCWSAFGGSNVV